MCVCVPFESARTNGHTRGVCVHVPTYNLCIGNISKANFQKRRRRTTMAAFYDAAVLFLRFVISGTIYCKPRRDTRICHNMHLIRFSPERFSYTSRGPHNNRVELCTSKNVSVSERNILIVSTRNQNITSSLYTKLSNRYRVRILK